MAPVAGMLAAEEVSLPPLAARAGMRCSHEPCECGVMKCTVQLATRLWVRRALGSRGLVALAAHSPKALKTWGAWRKGILTFEFLIDC